MVGRDQASSLMIFIQMNSAMSKLDSPVFAPKPLRALKLDLVGRFSLSRPPSSAFVTHGGFPTTSSGPVCDHANSAKFSLKISACLIRIADPLSEFSVASVVRRACLG